MYDFKSYFANRYDSKGSHLKDFSIRKYIGIPDILLIIVLTALPTVMLGCNFFAGGSKENPQIAVYVHGELYGKYDLDTPAIIEIGDTNTLEIVSGHASMIHADCRDQVCVHTAPIGKESPGHIVCLPNGIVVSVENAEYSTDIDGYVS